MNFLEIVQKVNTLSGVQGTITSVTDTGYAATIVELVKNAWIDIQSLRPTFNFFQQDTTFDTVVGKVNYTIADIFGTIGNPTPDDPVSSYRGFLIGSTPILSISKEAYILGDLENEPPSSVSRIAVDPLDDSLWIPPPDDVYTISVYYFANIQTLQVNTDVPICPIEFHNAIVYRAVADVAAFFGNSTMYQTYTQRANSMIGALMRSQNPALSISIKGLV